MKLEFREHELERGIEVYLQGLFKAPVKVNNFDLSGTRSKDGLSITVDFEIEGETDIREPRVESTNVKPTNTEWREDKESGISTQITAAPPEYFEILELLSDNALNKNYSAICAKIQATPSVVDFLENNAYYQAWKVMPLPAEDKETNTTEPTLDKEQEALDKLVLATTVEQSVVDTSITVNTEEPTPLNLFSNVDATANPEQPDPVLVASTEPEAPVASSNPFGFGEPLAKPDLTVTRKVFK